MANSKNRLNRPNTCPDCLAMFFVLCMGLVVYKVGESLPIAVLAVLVTMGAFTGMRLIPGYMIGLMLITSVGIGFTMRRV